MGYMLKNFENFLTLNSDEGAIDFLVQQTGLSRERVESIYRKGNPCPFSLAKSSPTFVKSLALLWGEDLSEVKQVHEAEQARLNKVTELKKAMRW